jgi:hypothetical protein
MVCQEINILKKQQIAWEGNRIHYGDHWGGGDRNISLDSMNFSNQTSTCNTTFTNSPVAHVTKRRRRHTVLMNLPGSRGPSTSRKRPLFCPSPKCHHVEAAQALIHCIVCPGFQTTVRAYHQLEFSDQSGSCIYCKLVLGRVSKSKTRCNACNFYFCFTYKCNHFSIWHSSKCDPVGLAPSEIHF